MANHSDVVTLDSAFGLLRRIEKPYWRHRGYKSFASIQTRSSACTCGDACLLGVRSLTFYALSVSSPDRTGKGGTCHIHCRHVRGDGVRALVVLPFGRIGATGVGAADA